jgi:hypothetical protein
MQPGRKRQQSPAPHLQMPYSPAASGPTTPTSQPSMDAVLAAHRQQQQDWGSEYDYPRPPPPRPSSFVQSRASGDGGRPYLATPGSTPPGAGAHPPMQVRQRT